MRSGGVSMPMSVHYIHHTSTFCSSWLTDCWFVLALYNIYNPMCLASSCNYQVFFLAFSVWESPLPDLGIGSGWQTVLSIRGPLLCWNLCRWEVYSLLKCVFLASGLGHNCCLLMWSCCCCCCCCLCGLLLLGHRVATPIYSTCFGTLCLYVFYPQVANSRHAGMGCFTYIYIYTHTQVYV